MIAITLTWLRYSRIEPGDMWVSWTQGESRVFDEPPSQRSSGLSELLYFIFTCYSSLPAIKACLFDFSAILSCFGNNIQ